MRGLILTVASVLLVGCFDSSRGCTTEVVPGIMIAVYDSETKEPLCGYKATAIDEFLDIEEVESPPSDECEVYSRGLAHEAPGVYQLIVEKESYENWVMNAIVVESGECHVVTENIDVYLEAL